MATRGINVGDVTGVLLHDGWHDVVAASFDVTRYAYYGPSSNPANGETPVLLADGSDHGAVCASAYSFTTRQGDTMAGPLTSVLAVRYDNPPNRGLSAVKG